MPRRNLATLRIRTTERRSRIMAQIRSSENASTEAPLVALLKKNGITGWRRHFNLVGKPDLVFPRRRVAIFVDGCFWHRCPLHGHLPRANNLFWLRKLKANQKRDRHVNAQLDVKGWVVIRIWEHDMRSDALVCLRRIRLVLQRPLISKSPFSLSATPDSTCTTANYPTPTLTLRERKRPPHAGHKR